MKHELDPESKSARTCTGGVLLVLTMTWAKCKRCRAEASMKIENRKKENAGLMESLELRTVCERDRERETQKNSISNNALTQCTCVCVQCTLLYKFLQGLTEVLSYFNAL